MIGEWNDNNSIYLGRGGKARTAHSKLRLSRQGGPVSSWLVPPWLKEIGLSYHRNEDRWSNASELQVVGRGQEFVADIGDRKQPRVWLMNVLEAIESPRSES